MNIATAPSTAGGSSVSWTAVPGAIGYFAQRMGTGEGDVVVLWSSSGTATGLSMLLDYVPPSEVRRLIAARAILPPSTSECIVPVEVLKAAPAGVLSMIAYGEEVNFSYPPRPANATRSWTPDWIVKVRYKSTTTVLSSMEG